jgi:hypothetical protein
MNDRETHRDIDPVGAEDKMLEIEQGRKAYDRDIVP